MGGMQTLIAKTRELISPNHGARVAPSKVADPGMNFQRLQIRNILRASRPQAKRKVRQKGVSSHKNLLLRKPRVFISTHGNGRHRKWGRDYHKAKNIPTTNVSSIEEVLEKISAVAWPSNGVRIITHAISEGIMIPLLRGGSGSLFSQELKLDTRSALKKELATEQPTVYSTALKTYIVESVKHHIVRQGMVDKVWAALNKQSSYKRLLTSLGISRKPSAGSDAHSFLWWVLDYQVAKMSRSRSLKRLLGRKMPRRLRRLGRLRSSINANVGFFGNELVIASSGRATPAPALLRQRRQQLKVLEGAVRKLGTAVILADVKAGYGLFFPAKPGPRYGAIQKTLKRGTYGINLGKVRRAIPKGALIEIKGCNIGKNKSWLEAFRDYFASGQGANAKRPLVSAPKLPHWYGNRRVRRRVYVLTEWLELGRSRIYPTDNRFQGYIEKVR